jgi:hypothetical protein
MIKRKINANGNDIEFEVLSRDESLRNKTYGDYLADAWNKLLSADPDRPDDQIYFIRTSPNPSLAPLKTKATISSDHAIFVPVISTAINTSDSDAEPDRYGDLSTYEKRRKAANKDTDEGDNPPEASQLTIDGKPIVDDLTDFRVETPEFELVVSPESPVHDRLDIPYGGIKPKPTVAAGYCVIIKSLPTRKQPYQIHIKANGVIIDEKRYYTEGICDLTVA